MPSLGDWRNSLMFRKRYEYYMVERPPGKTVKEIIAILNVIGSDGWELYAIYYGYFIVKRKC